MNIFKKSLNCFCTRSETELMREDNLSQDKLMIEINESKNGQIKEIFHLYYGDFINIPCQTPNTIKIFLSSTTKGLSLYYSCI